MTYLFPQKSNYCWLNLCHILQEDREGFRTLDDDNFIDDSGVDPAHRYGSDNEHSPSRAPQVCSYFLCTAYGYGTL